VTKPTPTNMQKIENTLSILLIANISPYPTVAIIVALKYIISNIYVFVVFEFILNFWSIVYPESISF